MAAVNPPERHYEVTHIATLTYPGPVASSYGRAVLLPRTVGGQVCHSSELRTDPAAEEIGEHRDYHENRSSYFAVTDEHTRLRVVAESLVTVSRKASHPDRIPVTPWEGVVHTARSLRGSGDQEHPDHAASVIKVADGALASPIVGSGAAAKEYAADSFTPGRPIGHVIRDLSERIHSDFTHRGGAAPAATIDEVLAGGSGTGPDLAHTLVACARAMGLAARYVSGYVAQHAGDPRHAWAAIWVPHGGWVQADPTNGRFVDDGYVLIGWGRDHSDVAPLHGVAFAEGDGPELSVDVNLAEVAEL